MGIFGNFSLNGGNFSLSKWEWGHQAMKKFNSKIERFNTST